MLDLSPEYLSHYARQVTHQRLVWPVMDHYGLEVYLRRDELASSHYPGNKFYKLFYNLREAVNAKAGALISFGGAYSNHIHALAMLGQACQIPTIGLIRGHQPKQLSPTLVDAQAAGMELVFLGYQAYRDKDIDQFHAQWLARFSNYYLIPEGGGNLAGVTGCQAIGQAIAQHFNGDYSVCTAVGTGTTFAGVTAGLPETVPCLGFSVLKGEDSITDEVQHWLNQLASNHQQWQLVTGYHHGGYARVSDELLRFMSVLEADNQLLLEPVYSAKMLWGIEQLAKQGFWQRGSQIVAIHGGGLQGRRGFSSLST